MNLPQQQAYHQWLSVNALSHSTGNWNRFISDGILELIKQAKSLSPQGHRQGPERRD